MSTDCLYGLVSQAFVLGPLEQLIYSWQQFEGEQKAAGKSENENYSKSGFMTKI